MRRTDPRRLVRRGRRRGLTLRARLTLVYGGIFLAAGLVLLGTTYALFNQELGQRGTLSIVRQGTDTAPSVTPPPDTRASVMTDEGDILTGPDAEEWMENEQSRLRDAATTSLITLGGLSLLVVGGLAAAFGWLVAGRVLAPLHRVTDTARRIAIAPAAGQGLHERIALSGPDDEVKDLADTFDTMIERLDRSFDGQRRFVANASHELRTPLTIGRALVEVAMHRKTASDDVRQLGENLLEIYARHERLMTGLMLLAGSESEIPERLPVDLADVVEHVVAQTESEANQAGLTVQVTTEEAVTSGDALLLERLVHNLVGNGIRHNTGDGGWVGVACRSRPDADRVEVQVSNTGPVVRPYEIPTIFEPFRRLGAERLFTGNGAGLGLSIVRSIARAHGGEVIAEPRDGGGLVVTVSLPMSRDLGDVEAPSNGRTAADADR